MLRELSLLIEPGQFNLVLGGNGAGKTTLLKVVSGMTRPDKGEVRFLNSGLSPIQSRGRISFCSTESFLYEELSLIENLRLFSTLSQIGPERAQLLMERFEIAPNSTQLVSELSSGVKKKASLVRAFLANSDVLVFDEALNFLDNRGKNVLMELIAERTKEGSSVVFASNRPGELLAYADQVINLSGGRLLSIENEALSAELGQRMELH